MTSITLIAAMDKQRAIGIKNQLPWRLPDDLKHFKQQTLNKTILMGRKTWESLPGILPKRQHLVMSRNKHYRAEGALVVSSVEQALNRVENEEQLMVVGGANLYGQMLSLADTLLLTMVDTQVQGDAFFPQWDKTQWQEIDRQHHDADEHHAWPFDFVTLKRK